MKILRQEGVTLLETLIAMAIFGTLMGVLLAMMNHENTLIRDSAEVLSARLKANETMETLKTLPFEELKSSSSSVVSELRHINVEVEVSDFEHSELFKKLVVRVIWLDPRGHESEYTLTTLRSRYSLQKINGLTKQTRIGGGGE